MMNRPQYTNQYCSMTLKEGLKEYYNFNPPQIKEYSKKIPLLVEHDITLAWSNVLVSKSSIEARKRQVEALTLAYDGVVVEEKLGTRTTLDVINAEQSLLDARTQLASAEREHAYAKFALLATTGELNLRKLKIMPPKTK